MTQEQEMNWTSTLHESIRTANYPKVQEAVRNGANLNHLDSEGNTPLANATKRGCTQTIKYLLRKKADISKVGENGKSPIHWAIFRDHLHAVKLILLKIINPNQIDGKRNPPLIYAAVEGKPHIAEFLLNQGAHVDKVGSNGRTPLVEAVLQGHFSTVKLLVERGANVDRLDGNTVLALAVQRKFKEIVEFLIVAEADVCRVGDKGKPPLSWAVINEDFELVELLLENGAEGSLQMALLEAIERNNREMVKFLVGKGAENINMKTVLEKAKEVGNVDIVKLFEDCDVGSDDEMKASGSGGGCDDSFVVL